LVLDPVSCRAERFAEPVRLEHATSTLLDGSIEGARRQVRRLGYPHQHERTNRDRILHVGIAEDGRVALSDEW
jgi:hypothetical protein